MTISSLRGASPYDGDYDSKEIEEILRRYDDYIIAIARKSIACRFVSPEFLDFEIQELAQLCRIKLWRALQKGEITYIKAYIRRIVHSVSIDMVRNHKHELPLPLDEEGELYQGNLLVALSEGLQDPVYELEQKELAIEYMTLVAGILRSLPPCQRRTMICTLKDQMDDLVTLTQVFKKCGVNIETIGWPSRKKELQSLRASLSIARKKLRTRMKELESVE